MVAIVARAAGRRRGKGSTGSPSAPVPRKSSHAGFTLLEVLVSLTLLAIGIAVALSLISGAIGNIRKVESRTELVEHAASVMELVLIDNSIQGATSFDGDFADGTRWRVRVEEFVLDDATFQPPQNMPAKLLSYTVEMSRPGSRSTDYRLRTLKLVPTQQSGQTARPSSLQDLVR